MIGKFRAWFTEPYRELLLQVLALSQQQAEITNRLVMLHERIVTDAPTPKRRELALPEDMDILL